MKELNNRRKSTNNIEENLDRKFHHIDARCLFNEATQLEEKINKWTYVKWKHLCTT